MSLHESQSFKIIKFITLLAIGIGVLRDDVRNLSYLPHQLFSSPYLFEPVISFFSLKKILSPFFLNSLYWSIWVSLAICCIKKTEPIGLGILCLLIFFHGNLLRGFAPNNFHNDVIPFYVLGLLTASRVAYRDAEEEYLKTLTQLVIVVPYFLCAVNKLWYGGLQWLSPQNLMHIIYTDVLNTHDHYFLTISSLAIPDFSFGIMSVFVLLFQLSSPLALYFSKFKRVWMFAGFVFHVGVFLFQRILFIDLLFMLLIFIESKTRRLTWMSPPLKIRYMTSFILFFFIGSFFLRIESYPISAWAIYARANTSDLIRYNKIFINYDDGTKVEDNLYAINKYFREQRYMKLIKQENRKYINELLLTYNSNNPILKIESIIIEDHEWEIGKYHRKLNTETISVK